MVARDVIVERRYPPSWANTSGIYANLSEWPRRVQYYVKCPKCGDIHDGDGGYKSLHDAHRNRLCKACNVEAINKIKDVVAHVDDPGQKPQGIAKILGEDLPLPEEPNFNARDELLNYGSSWVLNAKAQLEVDEGLELEFEEKDEADLIENPDDYDTFKLRSAHGHREFTVYKSYDVAEAAAVAQVKRDLEEYPENFNASWLKGFIDDDDLTRAIGDPYDDWEGDLEGKDVPETIEFLVGEDRLDNDDFYTKTGKLRKITKRTQQLLDAAIDLYKEETKPEFDPWEWLEDMHGSGGREDYGLSAEQRNQIRLSNAVKAALDLVSIDYDAAAESAVRADGFAHFLNTYDDASIDLEDGVIAVRNH